MLRALRLQTSSGLELDLDSKHYQRSKREVRELTGQHSFGGGFSQVKRCPSISVSDRWLSTMLQQNYKWQTWFIQLHYTFNWDPSLMYFSHQNKLLWQYSVNFITRRLYQCRRRSCPWWQPRAAGCNSSCLWSWHQPHAAGAGWRLQRDQTSRRCGARWGHRHHGRARLLRAEGGTPPHLYGQNLPQKSGPSHSRGLNRWLPPLDTTSTLH